jgi:ABC-type dipeptide/oligopeptide/nickel transport system ATPase component
LSSRVIVLKGGHIVEEGLSAEVLSNPRHSYTRNLIDSVCRLP